MDLPTIPYTACVLSAAALYLLIRPGRPLVKAVGSLIGLGALAWLMVAVGTHLSDGRGARPQLFFVIFSVIAIASAVRMITHSRPVYSALYFVLVVLSSAALFLLMRAEFIAFALVIVYAGAILVTYVFVLMLAQQSPDPHDPTGQPEYDLVPREPMAATVVAFIMLALLTNLVFDGTGTLPAPPSPADARAQAWRQLDELPQRRDRFIEEAAPGATLQLTEGRGVYLRDGVAYAAVKRAGENVISEVELPEAALPENVQRVGLDLILKFPVSLELAGIILLMAMFGAVVLARRQIELSEDELREAAGMPRLGFAGDAGRGASAEPGVPGGGAG